MVKALILPNIAPIISEDIGYTSINIHLNMHLVGLVSVIWFFKKHQEKKFATCFSVSPVQVQDTSDQVYQLPSVQENSRYRLS